MDTQLKVGDLIAVIKEEVGVNREDVTERAIVNVVIRSIGTINDGNIYVITPEGSTFLSTTKDSEYYMYSKSIPMTREDFHVSDQGTLEYQRYLNRKARTSIVLSGMLDRASVEMFMSNINAMKVIERAI